MPVSNQMATVWPLDNVSLADELNATNPDRPPLNRCNDIVAGIDIIVSTDAISNASLGDNDGRFEGAGPYLIAWSPSENFGQSDVSVLVTDLSHVNTITLATNMFLNWAEDIQQNPDLWRNGWDLERVRTTVQAWADRYGPGILSFLSAIWER